MHAPKGHGFAPLQLLQLTAVAAMQFHQQCLGFQGYGIDHQTPGMAQSCAQRIKQRLVEAAADKDSICGARKAVECCHRVCMNDLQIQCIACGVDGDVGNALCVLLYANGLAACQTPFCGNRA